MVIILSQRIYFGNNAVDIQCYLASDAFTGNMLCLLSSVVYAVYLILSQRILLSLIHISLAIVPAAMESCNAVTPNEH